MGHDPGPAGPSCRAAGDTGCAPRRSCIASGDTSGTPDLVARHPGASRNRRDGRSSLGGEDGGCRHRRDPCPIAPAGARAACRRSQGKAHRQRGQGIGASIAPATNPGDSRGLGWRPSVYPVRPVRSEPCHRGGDRQTSDHGRCIQRPAHGKRGAARHDLLDIPRLCRRGRDRGGDGWCPQQHYRDRRQDR